MKNVLFDERPIVCSPTLADMIGLNRAVFLQQIHYWLEKSSHLRDGRKWVYNSFDKWQEQLFFMSTRTLMRIVEELTNDGILLTGNYNVSGYDRTLWYSIDYDRLDSMQREHEEKRKNRKRKKRSQKEEESLQCSLFFPEDEDQALGLETSQEDATDSVPTEIPSSPEEQPVVADEKTLSLQEPDSSKTLESEPPVAERKESVAQETASEKQHREDSSRKGTLPTGKRSPPSFLASSLKEEYPAVHSLFVDIVHTPSKLEEKKLLLLLAQWEETLVVSAILTLGEQTERKGMKHKKPIGFITNYLARLTDAEKNVLLGNQSAHGISARRTKAPTEQPKEIQKTLFSGTYSTRNKEPCAYGNSRQRTAIERITKGMQVYIHEPPQS